MMDRGAYYLTGLIVPECMGARRNFSRGGQSHRHFKKSTRFRRAVQKIHHFSARRRRKRNFLRFFFRDVLDYNKGYLVRAPWAPAQILRYFAGRQHMTSFFLNSRGASASLAPLRAPVLLLQLSHHIVPEPNFDQNSKWRYM